MARVVAADRYEALADPTRRQILKLPREGDLPAGAIAEQFEMSRPSASRHLGCSRRPARSRRPGTGSSSSTR